MGGSIADIAAQFASSGNGGGDFWNPESGAPAARVRLYRVTQDGKPTLVGYSEEVIWTGAAYVEPNAEIEQTRSRLLASGTKEDKEKAKGLYPRKKAWLMCVLPDEPTGFRIWKASQTVMQRLLCIFATAGNGGLPVRFPKGPDPKFYELAETGSNAICGPNGQDLAVSFDKKAAPTAMYDVVLLPKPPAGFKVLPFSEEETPDPSGAAARIKAVRDKK